MNATSYNFVKIDLQSNPNEKKNKTDELKRYRDRLIAEPTDCDYVTRYSWISYHNWRKCSVGSLVPLMVAVFRLPNKIFQMSIRLISLPVIKHI